MYDVNVTTDNFGLYSMLNFVLTMLNRRIVKQHRGKMTLFHTQILTKLTYIILKHHIYM